MSCWVSSTATRKSIHFLTLISLFLQHYRSCNACIALGAVQGKEEGGESCPTQQKRKGKGESGKRRKEEGE